MDKHFCFNPIGFLKTCFATKNGTPRQPCISSVSKGTLKIEKSIFNNPEHSIEGLAQFSHVWIIFVFHLNDSKSAKAKVKPPRMNGLKTGVFSTRSPHRPNPIGITLAKLESVEKDSLHLSGLDIVDNTPVLDLKPFIPQYDFPQKVEKSDKQLICGDNSLKPQSYNVGEAVFRSSVEIQSENRVSNGCRPTVSQHSVSTEEQTSINENSDIQTVNSDKEQSPNKTQLSVYMEEKEKIDCNNDIKNAKLGKEESTNQCGKNERSYSQIATWLKNPPIPELDVLFSNRALSNIAKFHSSFTSDLGNSKTNSNWKLQQLKPEDLQQAILDILKADPRSSYRRKKCSDKLYYFTIDNAHITAWFDDSTPHCVEVLRIVPISHVYS